MEQDWLASLDQETRLRAERMIEVMRTLGADDPEGWVGSEIRGNIPQLARFLVLRRLWPEVIDRYRNHPSWIDDQILQSEADPTGYFADAGLALRRMRAAGVSEKDIASVARMVAYEAVFGVLDVIDEGYDPELEEAHPTWALPGWELVEVPADERQTRRHVGGLHESILSMDPSGREGRPG